MRSADSIRLYGKERYAVPARKRGDKRFSIRVGDVVRALGLVGRVPAVCSALKTGKFLKDNNLRIVEIAAPESGQSTTVVYTYEFDDRNPPPLDEAARKRETWLRLRGALKHIYAEYGGGEAYLRAERSNFYAPEDEK